MAEDFSLALDPSGDDASGDDAPEELTFRESEESALRSRRDAAETTRRERQQLKEKRRKKHEFFQEQKKRRLLPEDVLEEMDAAAPQKKKPDEDEAEDESEDSDEGVGTEEETDASGKMRSLKGGYTVRTVGDTSLAHSQQKAAAAFVLDRLYGQGTRRTTNKQVLSLKNKKGDRKAPAVEFVKKGWASKHKEKAERLKQRWLHQQQVASS
ncbi:hypothetical protein NHX12_004977 [Muraenolepis orangiensis]|uniref:U3 small nucleolar RNA-associated protein NOL7 C-terminal domain-containing protein n=1 Tax=Muraenolepis orangiensis TaxID=630683 RepID=A0A9Q0IEE8_9TELE|nr:hypothetical protein NHX12_004977 [Muraenolepis orangiensis]